MPTVLELGYALALTSAFAVGAAALRSRGTPGALPLVGLCAGSALWSGAALAEWSLSAPGLLRSIHVWLLLGTTVVVATLFLFAVAYSGYRDRITPRLLALLAVEPAVFLGLAVADPTGGELVRIVADGSGGMSTTGPGYLLHVAYSYVLLATATVLLARSAARSDTFYRGQFAAIFVALLVPWLLNAAYLTGLTASDYTQIGFTVTAVALFFATHRYGFMDVTPIARDELVDLVDDAMLVFDADGRVLTTNDAFDARFADGEAPVGRPLETVLSDYPALRDALDDTAHPPDVVETETPDGTVYFELTTSEIGPTDGEPLGRMALLHDITELKRREREIEANERRYRTLAENFPRGIVALFDESLVYQLAVGGLFGYIEYDRDHFEGSTIAEAHTEGYAERHRECFEGVFDGERHDFEFAFDGRNYRTRLVPVTDADGDVVVGMSMTTDVTELKSRERELERQNRQLETLASVVSHDLRNPLNVAAGRTELALETGELSHLETVQDSLRRMEELLEDVFQLARQGRDVGETAPVDLATLARTAWNHVDTEEATLSVETDLTIEADESRLVQVFENCYRNAVQHGRSDVTVTVGTHDDGFYVADDGPGIPPEEREAVFEHGRTHHEEGTGLGLAIVDTIASAHDWTVSVTESANGGARFEFAGVEPTTAPPEQD